MSKVDVNELFDKFGINYCAIQGSTDDVDLVERKIENLIEQTKSQLISALLEGCPKKLTIYYLGHFKTLEERAGFINGHNQAIQLCKQHLRKVCE